MDIQHSSCDRSAVVDLGRSRGFFAFSAPPCVASHDERSTVSVLIIHLMLDERFLVTQRGSTLLTEVRAGMTTFMTMAYILVVNPTVLAGAGLPFSAVAFATAITAVVGSGFVGLFGNLPFGLAPGMGLNAYFAYGVCVAKGIPYGQALIVTFLMGLTFGALSIVGACAYLQRVMPSNLKHATTVAIGIFQAFIGFRMINFVVADKHTLVALGDVASTDVLLGMSTTFFIGILVVHRVPGAMLVGIGASSCVSWALKLQPLPTSLIEMPTCHLFWAELPWGAAMANWKELVPVLLALLFVCIFDTAGVQFGAGMQAGLLDAHGVLPGTKSAFVGASLATALGGLLGTSPTIIHNETCAGIAEGGRTGLTALVVALMFALSIFFVPVFAAVPLTATAPALIIVGAFMMGPAGAMDWDNFKESLPAFLTITVMPLTYSIANGVVAGMFAYGVLELGTEPLSFLGMRQPIDPLKEPLGRGLSKCSSTTEFSGASAAASPHAMVRDPLARNSSSFGGISALGGKVSPLPSPHSTPGPVGAEAYKAPLIYPTPL